jgi:hypothetical protein
MNELIENVDLITLVQNVVKSNKSFQKELLNQMETILGKDTEAFRKVRKLYLDSSNDYTRTILRDIFGTSFEGEIR